MYFSTNRRTCEQTEKASAVHECEGNREKSPNGGFSLLLFFLSIQRKTVYFPPGGKDSPTCHCQGSCWGNNDCVIKMADRYCYQSFFKELFIHIITTFIITVLQMLSTLLSI